MLRAIACVLVAIGMLWAAPKPADACGVKLSLKGKSMKRSVVARATRPMPVGALVARKPIRVGPTTRPQRAELVATGGGETGRAVEPAPAVGPVPVKPAPREKTRVAIADTEATADTEAKEPVDAAAVVEPESEPKVFFSQANAILSATAKKSLIKNARWLKRHEARSILVEGHCSVTGPPEPNMALSEARAEAVKDFLVEMGVEESRIETKGYGLTKPRYKPATSPKNRRVVIRVRKS